MIWISLIISYLIIVASKAIIKKNNVKKAFNHRKNNTKPSLSFHAYNFSLFFFLSFALKKVKKLFIYMLFSLIPIILLLSLLPSINSDEPILSDELMIYSFNVFSDYNEDKKLLELFPSHTHDNIPVKKSGLIYENFKLIVSNKDSNYLTQISLFTYELNVLSINKEYVPQKVSFYGSTQFFQNYGFIVASYKKLEKKKQETETEIKGFFKNILFSL